MTTKAGRGMAWGPVALFCLLWSSAFAGAKFGLRDCPPLTLLTIRFFLAAIALLALAAWSGQLRRPTWREVGLLAVLGVLNNALYLGLSWSGMVSVSSAFTAVLISTNPLLIGVLAGPVLGERLTGRKCMGLLLGLAGVALVLRSRLNGMHEDPHGVWLVAAALVALVVATLLYKRCPPASGLWQATGGQALAGALALLPFALLHETGQAINWSPNLFWSLMYMVFAVSVGGYGLWFHILRGSSATAASALHFLMPPLGLLFGWLALGEHVATMDLLGILPIAAGIWLATRNPMDTGVSR
ncbi:MULTISPECIES: DMT family transporter [unclassified Achromobacter]|uniref:DMT family transporter n=1 Tax=unclassified Achromobacter TaxID=2626865 RepID=UPI000B5198CC|nr:MULTISPECIES: DMT family transporter [unclassified Achromobacter]OWT74405.1 EamA family transporter [Achromobacter sp. HZ34]OWT78872.1 EamA family transporter [Achromobacter sp. HZ28]